MTDTDTTIDVLDGSVFGASGSVWIGCEKCSFTRSGNTLTLTRGTGFQGNVSKIYSHAPYSPVYDAQYTEASPQSTGTGSSINTHGIKMDNFEMKEVIDQSTLDIVAEKLLNERKGSSSSYFPPESILLYPTDYVWASENIDVGDTITVADSGAGLSGTYRVYGSTLSFDNGIYSLELEVSNATLSMLNEIKDDADKGVVLSQYMQGAINIFAVNETDNVESGDTDYQGLTLFFNIPDDAVAINSIKLSYRNEAPKTWNATTAGGGSINQSTAGGGSINQSTANGGSINQSSANTDFTSYQGTDSYSATNLDSDTWSGNILDEAYSGSFNSLHAVIALYFNVVPPRLSFDAGFIRVSVRVGTGVSSDPKEFAMKTYYVEAGATSFSIWDTITIFNNAEDADDTIYVSVWHNIDDRISLSGDLYLYGESEEHSHTVSVSAHSHTVSVSDHTHNVTVANHTHAVGYDLAQQTYDTTDVKVWTSDNTSGAITWTERTSAVETAIEHTLASTNNTSELNIPLQSYFSSTGWKGIRLTTNGNSRMKAQVVVKCYVKSNVI